MQNIDDIKYGFKFDTNTILYKFAVGSWDGYADYEPTPGDLVFNVNSQPLGWETALTLAFEEWDKYTSLNIEAAGANTPNLYAYSANTNSHGAQAEVGFFDSSLQTTADYPTAGDFTFA